MAIKTFTSGEVLTASDTNTYLANAGLVYVSSTTVGSGVSSVTVSGAFSSTYDNYHIIYSGGVGSTLHNMRFQLGSATSGYYGFGVYGTFSGATVYGINDNNASTFRYIGGGDSYGSTMRIDVMTPQTTALTHVNAFIDTGTSFGTYVGRYYPGTQFTAFTMSPDSGTLTGGTITVYGYRKA